MNSELKRYEALVTQQEAETVEVWAHSAEEAEEILNGDGDHEEQPWYVAPKTIGSMHILSQIEEITEVPNTEEK
jgi:hypothetical protein